MADNFGSSFSDAFSQQQKIAVAEENNRLTAEQQRFDNIRKTLGIAGEIAKAASEAGKDPMTIAGAIQPVIESAASLARTPEEAQRILAMGQAFLARPPLEDKTTEKIVNIPGDVNNEIGRASCRERV